MEQAVAALDPDGIGVGRYRMSRLLRSNPAAECRWDLVSLGEVMLRFDPGEGRIHTTRSFNVWEGGGEYNVARSLRRCFGLRTAIATALADNPVGRLVEDLILQGGVDTSVLRWRNYDGVGREVRNGFNFVERGFGPRPPLGCSDRGHTAISQLEPGDFDWAAIFGPGVRCLHTGGVFAGLSPSTPSVATEAIAAARAHGTLVSYDLNYRESLWRAYGGNDRAREVNSSLVRAVDILFAGPDDFQSRLGVNLDRLDIQAATVEEAMLRRVAATYPNLHAIAMTQRTAESSCTHRWGAVALVGGEFVSVEARSIDILDRIGGGDSFAAGFLYGLLEDRGAAWALACGVARGALAMTTPGDTSMATLSEVERLMASRNVQAHR
jgi:2-dehydro-3-deoxygluconokinase